MRNKNFRVTGIYVLWKQQQKRQQRYILDDICSILSLPHVLVYNNEWTYKYNKRSLAAMASSLYLFVRAMNVGVVEKRDSLELSRGKHRVFYSLLLAE